jgi:hypothetical protein
MYGKLAAGLLTLGIAMSTTMPAQAYAALQEATQMECRGVIEPSSPERLAAYGVKTATSFQGGCNLGAI